MNTTKIKLNTIKAKNIYGELFTVIETYDDNAINPRNRSDVVYVSHFYTFERKYCSPDAHGYRSINEWADSNDFNLGSSPEDLIESMAHNGYIALPVWRYEHGGVSYSAAMNNPYNCPWDSGMVGIIYVAYKADQEDECIKTKDDAIKMLKEEVDEYSKYINGELRIYEVYDEDNNLVDSMDECYINDFCDGVPSPEAICSFFELLPL